LSKFLKMEVFLLFMRVCWGRGLANFFTNFSEIVDVHDVLLFKREFMSDDLSPSLVIKSSALLQDTIFPCRLVLVCLYH